MLRATLAFIFCFITLTKTSNENCNRISQTFYQTENKWYDLGCSESGKVQSNQTLAYQCRFLQKKMDIYGRKYYDFSVTFIFCCCNHFMPNSKENFLPRVGRPGQNVKTKDKKEMDKRALEEKK